MIIQVKWICDLCGNFNDEEATCECGCTEKSWLPVEPQRVEQEDRA